MYKHDCVQCLVSNKYKCKWNISFFDRLFGTEKVQYCPEYLEILNYNKRYKKVKLGRLK